MRKELLIVSVVLILVGCGGKSNNPAPAGSGGTTTTPPAPVKAVLTFPDQNAVCTSGKIISDTTSSITFTWNPSDNTNSYDMNLKNLATGVTITQNTTATQLTLSLTRNTPYSWYIVSKSTTTSTTAQSDTWKFYNAGKATVTYAPFPAEITSPTFGQTVTATTGTVNLTWKGTSVTAGTITGYDVYFGTTKSPALLKAAVTNSFFNNVSVASKTTYYWKVITKDIIGNTSDSGLYQFTVN
jgi:hypothetical protein